MTQNPGVNEKRGPYLMKELKEETLTKKMLREAELQAN